MQSRKRSCQAWQTPSALTRTVFPQGAGKRLAFTCSAEVADQRNQAHIQAPGPESRQIIAAMRSCSAFEA